MGLEDHSIIIGMLTGMPRPCWGAPSGSATGAPPFVPTLSLSSPAVNASPSFRPPRSSLGGASSVAGMSGGPRTGGCATGRGPSRGSISTHRSTMGGRASTPTKGMAAPAPLPPSPLDDAASSAHRADGVVGELPGGAALVALSTARLESRADDDDSPARPSAEDDPLRWMHITPDRVAIGRVHVHTSAGALHLLELPWLYDWALFLQAAAEDPSPPPVPPAESAAILLLAISAGPPAVGAAPFPAASPSHTTHPDARFRKGTGVVGLAALRDPSLGDALFAMTNDGKCTRVQVELVPLATTPAERARGQADGTDDARGGDGPLALDREYTRANQQLRHQRSAVVAPADNVADEMAWARSKAELADAAPADVLSAVERALQTLAGPGSRLREWGQLAEESATRLERLEKQSLLQPSVETGVGKDIAAVEEELDQLTHKARLAAAVQGNLEMRAKALRAVLRQPALWPCGELSIEEERQHRELLALRDRVLEGQRAIHDLISAHRDAPPVAAAYKPRSAPKPTGAPKLAPPPPRASAFTGRGLGLGGLGLGDAFDAADGDESEEDAALDEETAELMQQDALLQRLVSGMRRAKQQGDEALALAQGAVGE